VSLAWPWAHLDTAPVCKQAGARRLRRFIIRRPQANRLVFVVRTSKRPEGRALRGSKMRAGGLPQEKEPSADGLLALPDVWEPWPTDGRRSDSRRNRGRDCGGAPIPHGTLAERGLEGKFPEVAAPPELGNSLGTRCYKDAAPTALLSN